jgi:aspartate kinase
MGERMSVHLMAGCLKSMGLNAEAVETDGIGMRAFGEYGNGTVDLDVTREALPPSLAPLLNANKIPIVTGFFGETDDGNPITFGRGGTDYSAAVLADSLEANRLELWKDVKGFLSGAPNMVEESRPLSNLTYDEAAELAYFGAKILHPRTVEPLLDRKIPIVVRYTFQPEDPGTRIGLGSHDRDDIVQSVTYDRSVAMLRVHGADVGYTVGLLTKLVSQLSRLGINIRSVMTSQTCINILLDQETIQQGYEHLHRLDLNGVDSVEPIEDIGLVAIVGEGLVHAEDQVAKAIIALTHAGVHVELIVTGASKVAAYFIVKEDRLERSVRVVHEAFFDPSAV